jgi:primosomal protein N' (replication factor Y)
VVKKSKTYNTESLFESDESQAAAGHIVRVAFDTGADNEFDYILPETLAPIQPGRRVEAPFGRNNKLQTGFCIDIDAKPQTGRKFKLKTIKRVLDKAPLLDTELLALADWISKYYVCPLGQVLSAMVPAGVKKDAGVKKTTFVHLAQHQIGNCRDLVRAKKQYAIIDILNTHHASTAASGIAKKRLLELASVATDGPLKRLAQKGIVNLTERAILSGLPAIPENLAKPAQQVVLNPAQTAALTKINEAISAHRFSVTLLHGVTDSGKTELYIRAIQTVLKQRRRAIVMLPEIALTTQTIQRFSARFDRIAVMHCRLTPSQRNAQWQKINSGDADVVIGARSSVFAPLADLGLIVVDEEHEPSYKQDTVPRYHGRDVAIKRAQLAGAHCILGSATPSLETLTNCKARKHYQLVKLSKRVMDLPMPKMELINMSTQYGAPSLKASRPYSS